MPQSNWHRTSRTILHVVSSQTWSSPYFFVSPHKTLLVLCSHHTGSFSASQPGQALRTRAQKTWTPTTPSQHGHAPAPTLPPAQCHPLSNHGLDAPATGHCPPPVHGQVSRLVPALGCKLLCEERVPPLSRTLSECPQTHGLQREHARLKPPSL